MAQIKGQPRSAFPSVSPKKSVYNDSSSAIGAGLSVTADANGVDWVKLPAAALDPSVGITGPEGIPAKSWGSLIVAAGSKVPMKNTGGIAAGARLMHNTDGTVSTFSASGGTNKSLIGTCDVTAVDAATDECTFAGPGQTMQG